MNDTAVVVGAGVAGLAAAFHLKNALRSAGSATRVVCLEAADQPGGNIRTERTEEFLCEWGPNGFLDNEPATLELVEALGIGDRLLPSDERAAKRFLFRNGRLHAVPTGPGAFLRSGLLSWPGKLRLLGEPLAGAAKDGDESVFDFAARRIGREAAACLVDAMVSGVYAGDSRRLSLEATFPKMKRMEAEHGSLFRAMLALRRKAAREGGTSGGPAGPGGRLTSFRDGMQTLISALAERLGDALMLRTRVARVADMGVRGFRVHLAEGAPLDARLVIVACPAWCASTLLESADAELARTLAAIPGAPLAVVHLGFDRAGLGHSLDGFGFLVPRGEGPRILGCLWSSSIFAGRASAQSALLTCMIGGAHDPQAIQLSNEELLEIALRDLRGTMGILRTPRFVRVFRHEHGIPQYVRGHPERLRVVDRALGRHPGLMVCGNSYRGVSVNACAAEAPQVATRAASWLRTAVETRQVSPF